MKTVGVNHQAHSHMFFCEAHFDISGQKHDFRYPLLISRATEVGNEWNRGNSLLAKDRIYEVEDEHYRSRSNFRPVVRTFSFFFFFAKNVHRSACSHAYFLQLCGDLKQTRAVALSPKNPVFLNSS